MELVLDAREPAVGLYVQYAGLAYLAGQTRKGDLAGKRAEELAPKDQKEQVKQAIDQAKQSAAQASGTGRSDGPRYDAAERLASARGRERPRYHARPRPYSSTGRAADS